MHKYVLVKLNLVFMEVLLSAVLQEIWAKTQEMEIENWPEPVACLKNCLDLKNKSIKCLLKCWPEERKRAWG